MSQMRRRLTKWIRFSPGIQRKMHRHEHRISLNPAYREADRQAGVGSSKDFPLVDEVRQFYRLRLRDAQAFDEPAMRLADFFNHRRDNVVELTWDIPALDLPMIHRALEFHLAGWEALPPTARQADLFTPLRHRPFEVALGKWEMSPIECRRFWMCGDGRRICLEVHETISNRIEVCFIVRHEDHDYMRALWDTIMKWIDEHHYLRGQKFTADGRFLDLNSSNGRDVPILSEALLQTLLENTVQFLDRAPLHRRHGLPMRRGVLLHGPPGTGKTMVGREIARRVQATFISAYASDIQDGERVRGLFRLAQRLSPTILFFEDLDLVGANRHMADNREVIGELLSCLDGIETFEGVLTVATTNDLAAIEPALKDRPSRFDVILEVPPLNQRDCERFIDKWLATRGISTEFAIESIKLHGLTGAQLNELCATASLNALERIDSANESSPALLKADFDHALASLRPNNTKRIGFQS